MRLVNIVRVYHPAKGGHLREQAEWQACSGKEVHVITARAGSETELHAPSESVKRLPRCERLNGVTIWRVNPSQQLRRWLVERLPKWPFIWRLPARYQDAWYMMERGPFIPVALWRLLRLRPDIIHVISGYGPLPGLALLAGRLLRCPVVIMPCIHVNERWAHLDILLKWLHRCSRVLVFTESEREYLIKQGVPSGHIVVTGLGTNLQQADTAQIVDVRRKYGFRPDVPIILHLARLAPYKGARALILAMKELWDEGFAADLVLAGSVADGHEWLDELIEELGNAKSFIRLLEDFPDEDKAALLASCRIMAMPSKSESFGISYIETWSQARPVLAAPESAAASYVEHGVNGFLVSPDDQVAMVTALRRAIENPDEMNRMGKAGAQLVEERYRWDVVGRIVDEAYQSVLI